MFLLQAFKPGNKFGKYLLGSLIIIMASTLGQIPVSILLLRNNIAQGKGLVLDMDKMYNGLNLNLVLFLLLLSFVVALFAIILVVNKLHRQKIKEIITSRHRAGLSRILFAFSLWAVLSAGMILLTYFTEPGKYILQFDPVNFAILFVISIIMIPIQTTVEELVFRGYLMQGFGLLAKNRWFPLVMTSVIFGALHLLNPEAEKMGHIVSVYYIGTGLFLGIMTLMDEGTELAIGFHAANNLIAALLVTADWTVFQTYSVFKDVSEPSAGLDIIIPVLVIYPILLFIFARKYKWKNWSEKLTGNLIPVQQNEPDQNGYE